MANEKRLKLIGIILIVLMVASASWLVFTIGFQSNSTTTNQTNSQLNTSSNSSSKLPEPITVAPISSSGSNTSLRVDFTKERYNQRVEALNTRIRELKPFKEYSPSKEFCFALENVQGSADFPLNALKLDINYNSKAPMFEKIASDTRNFSIACKQHLAGSTGLLDDYKKQYLDYYKNLNELPKVD